MENDDKKKVNLYVRFSSVGIQMGVIIAFFTWLGTFLDKRQQNQTPVWTIILSLFGVATALYVVFKEVQRMNKDEK